MVPRRRWSSGLSALLDAWREEASVGQRTLVYKARGKSDTDVSLLQEPGIEGWDMLDGAGLDAQRRGVGAAEAPPRRDRPTSRRVGGARALSASPEAGARPREGSQPRRRAAPEPADAHLRRRRDRRAAGADHPRARAR